MKRILSVLLIFGMLSASADDSYLYWMLGDTTPYTTSDYKTIKVRANSGAETEYLSIYAPDAESPTGLTRDGLSYITPEQANYGALYAQLASGTPYSTFVIELWNDSSFVAQSQTLSYSEAVAQYYIETANSLHLATAWEATSFAVPEPNSAILMLLGCAALGLRRRQRRA